jgi:DNA-nicking Smr family endonuclease
MTDNISDDDKKLFRDSLSQASPIKKNNNVHHKAPRPKAKLVTQPELSDDMSSYFLSEMSTVSSQEYLYFHEGGLQNKILRQLRQNKLPIEAELALHGFTVAQAEKMILQFIKQAQQEHKKVIRIIHGKGFTQAGDYPPIKNTVNRMLRHNSQVLAFCSSNEHHGGTGSVNILLKRSSAD